jgi:hypothetical protein
MTPRTGNSVHRRLLQPEQYERNGQQDHTRRIPLCTPGYLDWCGAGQLLPSPRRQMDCRRADPPRSHRPRRCLRVLMLSGTKSSQFLTRLYSKAIASASLRRRWSRGSRTFPTRTTLQRPGKPPFVFPLFMARYSPHTPFFSSTTCDTNRYPGG